MLYIYIYIFHFGLVWHSQTDRNSGKLEISRCWKSEYPICVRAGAAVESTQVRLSKLVSLDTMCVSVRVKLWVWKCV